MRKSIASLLAATTFLVGGAFSGANAQEAPEEIADEAAEGTDAEPEGEEIVVSGEIDEGEIERCRIIRITGTRFRERVCMTQNERDEQMQNNRDVVNDNRYEGAPPTETDANGFPVVPPI